MTWHLRTSFDQILSLEKFYTGGPVVATHSGAKLVCFYENRLSLLTVPFGRYESSIPVSEDRDMLTAMAIHPKADEVLVTSKSGMMYVIDLITGQTLRSRKSSHGAVIVNVSFDPTGTLFVTASADKSIRVCDYNGLYDTHCFRDFSAVCIKSMFLYDVDFPTNYLYLVTLSRAELMVHELHAKKLIGKITSHLSSVSTFTILDDYLISSGEDKVLIITQLTSGALIQKGIINIHSVFADMIVCNDCLIGPSTLDGDMLRFVLSEFFKENPGEKYVNYYTSTGMDLNCTKDLMATNNYFCSQYTGFPFDEETISEFPQTRKHNSYIDIRDFFYTIPYPVGSKGETNSAVHHFILATTSDLLILLFDATTMEYILPSGKKLPDPSSISSYKQLPRFRMLMVSTICSDSGEVLDIKQVSNNELAVGTSSNHLRIVRYVEGSDTSGIVTIIQSNSYYGHDDCITCISASVESRAFCTASKDGTVRLWQRLPLDLDVNLTTLYKTISALSKAQTPVQQLSLIPYPLQLAIMPWVCTAVMEGVTSDIDCVTFGARKRWFAVTGAADKCIRTYNLSSFSNILKENMLKPRVIQPVATVLAHLDSLTHMTLAPNQRQLATVSADLSLKLWDIDDLTHPRFLAEMQKVSKKAIWSVEYSSYEKLLALACGDKRIRLIQIAGKGNSSNIKMSLFKTLEGHTNAVMKALFISHGQQIISVGADGLIKVWNVETSECVLSTQNARKIRDLGLDIDHLYGKESLRKMWGLVALDDGRAYVTGDSDGIIRWYIDNTEEVEKTKLEAERIQILQKEEVENVLVGSCLDRDSVVKAFRLALNIYTTNNQSGGHTAKSNRNADSYLQKVISLVSNSEEQTAFLVEAIEVIGLFRILELLQLARAWLRNSRLTRLGTVLLLALFRAYPVDAIVQAYGDRVTEIIADLTRLMEIYLRRLQLLRADSMLIDMSYSYFSYLQLK